MTELGAQLKQFIEFNLNIPQPVALMCINLPGHCSTLTCWHTQQAADKCQILVLNQVASRT